MLVLKSVRPQAKPRRSYAAPLFIAGAFFLAFPTAVAFQDMASLISGSESGKGRWQAFLKPSAAGSVHQAEMPFTDSNAVTGSIAGAGISQKGVGTVALTQKAALDPLPGRRAHQPRREARPHRLRRADRAAQSLQRRLGAGAPKLAAAPDPAGRSENDLRQSRQEGQGNRDCPDLLQEGSQEAAKPKLSSMIAELADDKSVAISANAYAPVEPDFASEFAV